MKTDPNINTDKTAAEEDRDEPQPNPEDEKNAPKSAYPVPEEGEAD